MSAAELDDWVVSMAVAQVAMAAIPFALGFRLPRPKVFFLVLAVWLVAALWLMFAGVHRCNEGYASWWSFLVSMGWLAPLLFSRRAWVAAVASAAVFSTGLKVTRRVSSAVHGPAVTANPLVKRWQIRELRHEADVALGVLRRTFASAPVDGKNHVPGPVLGHPTLPESAAAELGRSGRWLDYGVVPFAVEAQRYSAFTGVYAVDSRRVRLWYPGGRLPDAAAGLHYRLEAAAE